jgi:hypothetical protein
MRSAALVLAFVLFGCHTGDFDQPCNKDGSCNGPNLVCDRGWEKCMVKEPPRAPGRCSYESECFCVTCADKCGDAGVKTCAYSDTSVWGAKPAVCECK